MLGWNADAAGSALDVSYTLLPGWSATETDSGDVILHLPEWVAPGSFGVPAVTIFADPLAPRQPCGDTALPKAGTDVEALHHALAQHPGLEVTVDEPVEVGGLSGRHLDLTLADGWTDTCPGAAGEPAVAYLIDDHGTHLHRTVTADTPVRLFLLEAGDRTVAVEVAVPASRVDFEQYVEVAQQMIDTLDFDVAP
ncbi:hypothetical protein [Demequina maris]|uniref:hypothetical protein n=1 Tax=Demequina maris TaxID=1638982 RepID=UPI0012E02E4F|nr:hypothetical protein [Demequina maris]